MPKPTKGARLGGGPAHERLLLANMAGQLFTYKSIKTTETKAKRLRPVAERLVTFAKRGDLHSRRRVLSILRNKETTHVLFSEVAPLVELREGGYTRITKLGFRKGDNASMVQIELVLEPVTPKTKKSSSKAAAAAPASTEALLEEPAEELTTSDEAIIEATTEALDADNAAETTEADAEAAFSDEAPADDAAADEAKK
ncbi:MULTISPECIES: 50S ribosomal protein L17 [unclassified Frondihabitans]|uniref:50S ribosomal protein L17 n=1 Tax=unclassified Frondihabitans TaxID=2626248 RepID=UPI000F4F773C|nr:MULTISPECIES: 50S ribosomal protein L17 [unclassified Frondihabitans]RPE77431.1 large subunit ribosomal protein L17 [Frondihabitans sp. PhB153]RPF07707.1 large subunit ribosomal protein L17 [Frondihabitans sp. PhB161]